MNDVLRQFDISGRSAIVTGGGSGLGLAIGEALELARYRIRVNAIAPGPFKTNIAGGRMNDPDVYRGWQSRVPLNQVADPECIKPLALFLASDASRYVTGAQIVIDGGMSLEAVSSCALPS